MRSQESIAVTSSVPSSGRLAAYLAAGVGSSMLATSNAEAAIVTINVSTFNGVNAGMTFNQASLDIDNFVPGGNLDIYFDNDYIGLDADGVGGSQFRFAVNPGEARPNNFAAGTDISAWAGSWSSAVEDTVFYYQDGGDISPNFGPGSFMGFRFGDGTNWNYGWIEVTWNWTGNRQTSTFQIIAAAYESTANTAILTPIPAPSALALLALGGGAFRRARARAA